MKTRPTRNGLLTHLPAPRSWRAALACLAVVGTGLAAAVPAAAEERVRAGEAASPRQLQRIELRRALAVDWTPADKSRERRSLSEEERRALHRDLRDAMRGAYPDEARAKKRR